MKNIFYRKNYPSPTYLYLLGGFIQVATGLVAIITLGFYDPAWHVNYLKFLIKRRCRRVREGKDKL